MKTMKRIAMLASAALVLAACGGGGGGGVESEALGLVIAGAGFIWPRAQGAAAEPVRKREVVLSAGDVVDVVIDVDPANSKRLVAYFLASATGDGWIERFDNSASGLQSLRISLAVLERSGVVLIVEGVNR